MRRRLPDHVAIEALETVHGRCVIVEVPDDRAVAAVLALLPREEQERASALSPLRRRELVAGRAALHVVLDELGLPETAILADDRGAPRLPAGWIGSVSHKGARAAAIVAPADGTWVGLDLELAAPPRGDIARRILTPREQAALPDRGAAVTLRFAIKEAIYKAVDPTLRRYVGFTEVELDVGEGTAVVTSELPLAIEAAWQEHGGHWLATARARPR